MFVANVAKKRKEKKEESAKDTKVKKRVHWKRQLPERLPELSPTICLLLG